MANKKKRQKYIDIMGEDLGVTEKEAVKQAGYSKNRISTTVSLLRRDSKVQAEIRARRALKLQVAPSVESYHETLARAEEAAIKRGDSWALVQIANMKHREVFPVQAEPEKGKQPSAVLVKFVGPPEQAADLNQSTAAFEAQAQLPSGFLPRVEPEPEAEVTPPEPPLRTNEKREVCCHHGTFTSRHDPRKGWTVCPSCVAEADKDQRWLSSLISAGDGRVN